MKKAGLYVRVSTEEQAMHGYSLEAQRENLTEYAKKHDMAIIDYYVDEGLSARKKYTTRKEFMRMLDDAKKGEIDIILFIKLDRWFRSVADYYKVQEILDKAHVDWIATMENYDTATANGRLNLNIKLSIAQNESDTTSERIKFVFENKVKRGEVITGSVPMGLKIVDKHLVIDNESVDIVKDIFDYFEINRNKYATIRYTIDKYGINVNRRVLSNMLQNSLYKGMYRKQENFCEAIIDPERFDSIQTYCKTENIKKCPTNRIYIFSGLMVCKDCGHIMSGRFSNHGGSNKDYYYYRCRMYIDKKCSHKKVISESVIEEFLLENAEPIFIDFIASRDSKKKALKKQRDLKATLQSKLSKIKDLYMNDLISLDDYKKDYELYQKQLSEIPEPSNSSDERRIEELKKLLGSNFKLGYFEMGKLEKRAFWHSVINRVLVDSNNQMSIFFI